MRTVYCVQLLELVDKRAVLDDLVVHDIVICQGSHKRTRDAGQWVEVSAVQSILYDLPSLGVEILTDVWQLPKRTDMRARQRSVCTLKVPT